MTESVHWTTPPPPKMNAVLLVGLFCAFLFLCNASPISHDVVDVVSEDKRSQRIKRYGGFGRGFGGGYPGYGGFGGGYPGSGGFGGGYPGYGGGLGGGYPGFGGGYPGFGSSYGSSLGLSSSLNIGAYNNGYLGGFGK